MCGGLCAYKVCSGARVIGFLKYSSSPSRFRLFGLTLVWGSFRAPLAATGRRRVLRGREKLVGFMDVGGAWLLDDSGVLECLLYGGPLGVAARRHGWAG